MALFREHVSFGAIAATLGVVLAHYYAFATDWRLLLALFLATVLGSFLPDLDSDSGVPFATLFGTLTLVAGGLTLYSFMLLDEPDPFRRYGIPLGVGVFVWAVLGWLFKKLTHHRGMFHSVPATLIAGLTGFLVVRGLIHDEYTALVLGLGVAGGYLSHLVLDEFHSGVNVDGSLFSAKRSLGTALKFASNSKAATSFTYAVLVLLIYLAFKPF